MGGKDFWGGFGWIRPPPRDILGFLSLRVQWQREQRLPANSLKEFRCLAPGPAGDFYWRQKRKEKRQIRSRSGEEPERNKGTPKAAGLAEQRSRIPQFLINFSFLPLGPGPGGGQRFQGTGARQPSQSHSHPNSHTRGGNKALIPESVPGISA